MNDLSVTQEKTETYKTERPLKPVSLQSSTSLFVCVQVRQGGRKGPSTERVNTTKVVKVCVYHSNAYTHFPVPKRNRRLLLFASPRIPTEGRGTRLSGTTKPERDTKQMYRPVPSTEWDRSEDSVYLGTVPTKVSLSSQFYSGLVTVLVCRYRHPCHRKDVCVYCLV